MAAGGGAISALLAACVFAVVGAAFGGAIGLTVGPFCGPFVKVADFWVIISVASFVSAALVGVPCAIAGLCHGAAASWRGEFSIKRVLKSTVDSYISGNAQYVMYSTLRRTFRR